jgi:predicted RNA methylase
MNILTLDRSSSASNPLVRLRLVGELGKLKKEIESQGTGPVAAMNRLKLIARANEIRIEIGGGKNEPISLENEPTPSVSRRETASLYEFKERNTKGKRQKANNAAIELVDSIKSGALQRNDLTDQDLKMLAGYTGNGGSLVGADGKKGSAFEYYTPVPVAAGVWDALSEMGFKGGKVLDPSAGTGIFGATAPQTAAVDAVELDETSGTINDLVNGGDDYTATVSPFEAVAAATPDEIYDAVVTNVPFGTTADRGGNQLLDTKYRKDTLETYFILRSLDKLKPGGLAAFIVPPRCTTARGGSDRKLRERASLKAEFMGAYRLPNKVFGAAAADTITDVIFFRKYSRDAAQKIDELLEQDPAKLSETKVLWDDYLEGKYFATVEGRPRVLGEFKAKDPDKFRDVDRVENPKSVPEISKMLRKLPNSRVDWSALDAAETMPIEYHDGDTIAHGGQTLEMRNNEWVALDSTSDDHEKMALLGKMKDAYTAFESNVSFADAESLVGYMHANSMSLDIPGWLSGVNASFKALDASDREIAWRPVLVGCATRQVLDEVGRDSGTNFLTEYAALSAAMKRQAAPARRIKGVSGYAKQGLGEINNHYKIKGGYSDFWQGMISRAAEVVTTTEMGLDGLRYKAKSHWIDIEGVKAVMAGDFDPMASDDWCFSADGTKICHADDYYVGNYQAFLSTADAAIAGTDNEALKEKLLRQKMMAADRIDKVDLDSMQFNLFSPYVTIDEKVDFLRRFVDPRAVIEFDEKTGDRQIAFDIRGSNLTDKEKLLKRMGNYMKRGSVTLGGAKLDMADRDGIKALRGMVKQANEQFNGWAKASDKVKTRLNSQLSDPEKLRFRMADDEAPIHIPGLHPDFKPHGYQRSFARKMARDFAGINAFGTGLGKTFTALMSVQYVQSIGAKKKTLFVVPGSVLSNWHKEAVVGEPGKSPAYASGDDCLFIGLREKKGGKFDVSSSLYDEDLNRILENNHAKIFMTFEAFERIPMKDGTIEGFEKYMRRVDASFAESEDKKEDERKKGKAKTIMDILGGKDSSAPFLEDMGVDSIVIDEGHAYKNSAATVDFTGAKYLSVSEPAKRGLDAQAKCWFIRDQSDGGDGIMPLTATPLTNSPLEIYSMLSLAYGHDRINDMMGGISGADEFMNAVCDIEDEDEEMIDGKVSSMRVFKGLKNAGILRNMLHQVATVKSSEDVGNQITVPDAPEESNGVALPENTVDRLGVYKDAYRFAVDTLNEKSEVGGSLEAFNEVSQFFGEPIELIGHPFNLINKMTMLVADPDLDRRLTQFVVADAEKAKSLVEKWNKRMPYEDRNQPGPNADASEAKSVKLRKVDGEVVGRTYRMPVKAWESNGKVFVDTTDWKIQERFEEMAAKDRVDLDVIIPPKLASMLENVQKESASVRGIDADGKKVKRAKQIIFCDLLPMHNKIRMLLEKRVGIPRSRIAIITGQRNNSAEDILSVQDGFNGTEENSKYDIVIANKKAEVGINLQRGTQAIHHLTIGWTPDSLTQRNGRGVRQGNKTSQVNIYHYDADGTFDSAKRTLVNNKASWINSLMDTNGSDSIEISGGLSREQMDALIGTIGDKDGVSRMQEALAAKNKADREVSNRGKQLINLDTIEKQNKFLSVNEKPRAWVGRYLGELMTAMETRSALRSRLANPKVTAGAEARYTAKLAEVEPKITGIVDFINNSALIRRKGYNGSIGDITSPEDLVDSFRSRAKRGENRAANLVDLVAKDGYFAYSQWEFEVKEDSELYSEWQSEIDMAESLRDESVKNYEKQSEGDASLPKEAASSIANGNGLVLSGQPVYSGCFIVNDQNKKNMVVFDGTVGQGFWSAGRNPSEYKSWQLAGGRVVYPGSDEYADLSAAAAVLEDELTASGSEFNSFSMAIPDVAALRKVEVSTSYDSRKWILPSPYFPVAMRPRYGNASVGSSHLDGIIKKQSEIIRSWDAINFLVPASTEVQPIGELTQFSALRDYYFANGIRAKRADFNGETLSILKYTSAESVIEKLKSKLEEVDPSGGEEGIRRAANDFVADEFLWLDAEGDEMYFLGSKGQAIVNNAIYSLNAGVTENDEQPVITAPAIQPAESPEDFVNVTGDTMKWKGEIKAYAKKYRAIDKARWNRNAVAWKIRRGAFDLLVKDWPQAANELNVR